MARCCPIRSRLKRHLPILHTLKTASPRMRSAIINTADKSLLLTLSECSLNVLNQNQRISPRCKAYLRRYRNQLRQLAASPRQVSFHKKRRVLQRGGFLSILLGSLLSGLLSKLV